MPENDDAAEILDAEIIDETADEEATEEVTGDKKEATEKPEKVAEKQQEVTEKVEGKSLAVVQLSFIFNHMDKSLFYYILVIEYLTVRILNGVQAVSSR